MLVTIHCYTAPIPMIHLIRNYTIFRQEEKKILLHLWVLPKKQVFI